MEYYLYLNLLKKMKLFFVNQIFVLQGKGRLVPQKFYTTCLKVDFSPFHVLNT